MDALEVAVLSRGLPVSSLRDFGHLGSEAMNVAKQSEVFDWQLVRLFRDPHVTRSRSNGRGR